MKRLIMVVLALLMFVGVAAADTNQGPDKRYAIQICTEQTGTRHGECWWVQAFPVGSLGLGRTARLQAVSAALYAYSVASGAPLRVEIGAGTAAAALRVTTASDSVSVTLLTAIRDAVQTMADWDEAGRAAVNVIPNQIGIAAAAGATTANTTRSVVSTDSPGVTTAEPGYSRHQDGDSAVLADVLDTSADNMPYTLNGVKVECVMYGNDGATSDMVDLGPAGGIQIFVNNHPSAFDEGNSNVDVDVDNRTPVYGNAETSGTIVGAATVVCTARDVSTANKGCFYIKNQGGAGGGPFTAATWSSSAENVDWTDPVDMGAPCNALTTGKVCKFCWDDADRWIRASVTAAAAANDTTARCTYVGKM